MAGVAQRELACRLLPNRKFVSNDNWEFEDASAFITECLSIHFCLSVALIQAATLFKAGAAPGLSSRHFPRCPLSS